MHAYNFQAKPNNVTIVPWRSSYKKGDKLTCQASGHPEPAYYWTNLATGNISFGSEREVLDEDKDLTFRCTATNIIGGQIETASKEITLTAGDVQIGKLATEWCCLLVMKYKGF